MTPAASNACLIIPRSSYGNERHSVSPYYSHPPIVQSAATYQSDEIYTRRPYTVSTTRNNIQNGASKTTDSRGIEGRRHWRIQPGEIQTSVSPFNIFLSLIPEIFLFLIFVAIMNCLLYILMWNRLCAKRKWPCRIPMRRRWLPVDDTRGPKPEDSTNHPLLKNESKSPRNALVLGAAR